MSHKEIDTENKIYTAQEAKERTDEVNKHLTKHKLIELNNRLQIFDLIKAKAGAGKNRLIFTNVYIVKDAGTHNLTTNIEIKDDYKDIIYLRHIGYRVNEDLTNKSITISWNHPSNE